MTRIKDDGFRRAVLIVKIQDWWKEYGSEPSVEELASLLEQGKMDTRRDLTELRRAGFIERSCIRVIRRG